MTSIPASRSAAAITFAPRSWPSRPGFATRMRMGRGRSAPVIGAFLLRGSPGSDKLAAQGRDVRAGATVAVTISAEGVEEDRLDAGAPRAHHVHGVEVAHIE